MPRQDQRKARMPPGNKVAGTNLGEPGDKRDGFKRDENCGINSGGKRSQHYHSGVFPHGKYFFHLQLPDFSDLLYFIIQLNEYSENEKCYG